MNYFLTANGLVQTKMDEYNLFLHMKLGVFSHSEVKAFNYFKGIIELPGVIFRHQEYTKTEIYNDFNMKGSGSSPVEYLPVSIKANQKKGRIYVIDCVTNYESGIFVRFFTLSAKRTASMFRVVIIDEILKTL